MDINEIFKCFICEDQQIKKKLVNLTLIKSDEDCEKYIDVVNVEEWEKVSFWSEMEEENYTLLEKRTKITRGDLIYIATTFEKKEFVICACNELLRREAIEDLEFRGILTDSLEQILKSQIENNLKKGLHRLKSIIYETQLYDGANKKSILNKPFLQVKEESAFYETISKRAKSILSILGDT